MIRWRLRNFRRGTFDSSPCRHLQDVKVSSQENYIHSAYLSKHANHAHDGRSPLTTSLRSAASRSPHSRAKPLTITDFHLHPQTTSKATPPVSAPADHCLPELLTNNCGEDCFRCISQNAGFLYLTRPPQHEVTTFPIQARIPP